MFTLNCVMQMPLEVNTQAYIKRSVLTFDLVDLQARTYTTQIAKQLFEYIKGDKCIISSEAEVVSELRFPGDIFYL